MRKLLPLTVVSLLLRAYNASPQTLQQVLDNSNLVFTTGGSNNISWNPVSTTGSFDGAGMAISGTISSNQATWIQTTVTGPGTLSFWWKVFSESNTVNKAGDNLQFLIDGNLMNEISGSSINATEWQYQTYSLGPGVHTNMWQYIKDGSVNVEPDQGYLDEVSYTTNAPIPLGQALNTCGIVWNTNTITTSNAVWYGQTNVTHDGVAAESGSVYGFAGSPVDSWLKTPANGATNVSFWWKVSSNTNYNFLEFYIDSSRQAGISGEVNWKSNGFTIPLGATNLEWRYVKSNAQAAGSEHGWLDQVVIKPPRQALAYSIAASPGMTNNEFQLTVAGEVGCTCRVDYSTNLANWTPLTSFVTTNLINVVIDSGAANSPQRFYRAASP